MKKIIIFILLFNLAFGGEGKFLLNSYYNPNRLVFRLAKSSFECSLLGVAVPFYGRDNQCIVESFKKMSHQSIGYFQNNLNLEQLYSVRIENGFCILSYGNTNFNEKIIKDGYGVVNKNGILDMEFLNRLLYLQDLAIKNRNGLWNSFYNEMDCFKNSY
ncbi:hypothetical protein CCY99_06990 [Helicobacter sp. 16-1353]|uniref:thermonuclease family protein n=1 Tax=Helicobacter sp. 16-1353 TaxID=2004996 RepID=UPI000DCE2609|nr:thermonuclease family protein [Helicobacter sp. 16-1353]RAX52708.1 hypothetical protein CCY99_06990 [Helicobacter sp. 16-1353]